MRYPERLDKSESIAEDVDCLTAGTQLCILFSTRVDGTQWNLPVYLELKIQNKVSTIQKEYIELTH